jgi:hypothetical protein
VRSASEGRPSRVPIALPTRATFGVALRRGDAHWAPAFPPAVSAGRIAYRFRDRARAPLPVRAR